VHWNGVTGSFLSWWLRHFLFIQMGSEKILCWNVGGLNARVHRDIIRELVALKRPSVVSLRRLNWM
jgi:hypothetical protein